MVAVSHNGRSLPAEWEVAAQGQLAPGEQVLAWLETDLDQRLRYARGVVLLTDGRLLSASTTDTEVSWQSWPLEEGTDLRSHEHGGAGAVELVAPTGRLTHWRFTAGQSAAAGRLVQRLAVLRAQKAGVPPPNDEACPSCGGPINPEDGQCPSCSCRAEAGFAVGLAAADRLRSAPPAADFARLLPDHWPAPPPG